MKKLNKKYKIIKLPRCLAKVFLYISNYTHIIKPNLLLVLCKGYDDDYKNYTELVWGDDKDLDFSDRGYSDSELWIKVL